MTPKRKAKRVAKILDSLPNAAARDAARDYSAKLDFASENERRLRMITDNIRDVIWTLDFNWNYTYLSPSVFQLTGFTVEEVLALPLKTILSPHIFQEIESRLARELEREARGEAPSGSNIGTLELQMMHKTGKPIWVEVSANFTRDENGKPLEIVGVTRDISERRKAEEALRESETIYRKALETTSDGVAIVQSGKYVYINPQFLKTLNLPKDQKVSSELGAFIHPDDSKMLKYYYAKRLRGEPTPGKHEIRVIKPDQTMIYLQVTSVDIAYHGKPALLNFMQDITTKKLAEEALKESEKRYRMIVENMHDSISIMDLNFQYTYQSPSEIMVTGFTPEELMRIPIKDQMTPASYELAEKTLARELELEFSGNPVGPHRSVTMELEVYHKNGGTIWEEVNTTFQRDENGKPIGLIASSRDITSRKKAEIALAESEKLYRMIVENMQDVIWIMDFNLQYKYRSPSSMRITGYTMDELMAIPTKDAMTPASYARATEVLLEELAHEQSGVALDPHRARTMELEVYRKDGETTWIEVTATFNRNEKGEPVEILLAARDIMARKKMEEALRESEKRYRMIVENIHDSISLLDLNFEYIYISPSEIMVTGFTPEETMKLPMKDRMTPASYAMLEKVLAEELELEASGRPIDPSRTRTLELEVIHKSGGTVLMELTATFNRDESGQPIGLMTTSRNITEKRKAQEELQKSEQRYRMIIENIHEVIWMMDLNFRYTYISSFCKILTGHTPEEIMNSRIDQLVTPDSAALAFKVFSEQMELESSGAVIDPHRSITLEQETYHKNGGTVLLELSGTFIRDENGGAIGLLIAGRDVTEKKKAAEEKDKLEAQLMQAQKMEVVGRLAGGVAHDFNNMLGVILGYVDLAKLRLAKQHPVLMDLVEIEKAAIRSRDITTQLLAFSRKQIIEPKIIDLNDLIVHTQKALIRLIGEDIELKFHPGDHLWAIKFDPSQVEQILINLAVNARDAMHDGGKLTIETANLTLDALYCRNHIGFTPGQYVRLSFSDNGMGMDKETVQYIFEPFYTTKEVGKGTGLGLSTVYGIVKQNNSFINVYSEPGRGTTFSLYLPRTSEAGSVQDASEEEPEIGGQGSILLVEDDAMVLQITKGMLESIGYGVTAISTPLEAISLFKSVGTTFDLVITDVVMPGLSGKDLREKLLAIRPDIKVLFMSGYTADVIARHGVLEEGVHFLQKPFTIKSLSGKVREVLHRTH